MRWLLATYTVLELWTETTIGAFQLYLYLRSSPSSASGSGGNDGRMVSTSPVDKSTRPEFPPWDSVYKMLGLSGSNWL